MIRLENEFIKSKHTLIYSHIIELIANGLSKERQYISRMLPIVSLKDIELALPNTLECIQYDEFGKKLVTTSNHSAMKQWFDGGYPILTSDKQTKKEIVVLKKWRN